LLTFIQIEALGLSVLRFAQKIEYYRGFHSILQKAPNHKMKPDAKYNICYWRIKKEV
jgi:hypothetical protein